MTIDAVASLQIQNLGDLGIFHGVFRAEHSIAARSYATFQWAASGPITEK